MAFQKYTAPPPPPPKPKPHVKIVRTVIQFTEDGLAHLGEIAGKLKEATNVPLWHDSDTHEVAITPAHANDPDAFSLTKQQDSGEEFFEHMRIEWPIKHHSKTVEPHDGGVKLTVGSSAPAARTRRTAAAKAATPAPKSSKAAWKPGDPLGRGKRTKVQTEWLATDDGKKWLAAQGK